MLFLTHLKTIKFEILLRLYVEIYRAREICSQISLHILRVDHSASWSFGKLSLSASWQTLRIGAFCELALYEYAVLRHDIMPLGRIPIEPVVCLLYCLLTVPTPDKPMRSHNYAVQTEISQR